MMMEQLSDRQLVEATLTGNKDAFGRLIERHMPRALHVAQHMLGDREGAQDLAQEAFLQAYLSLAQLQQPDHFANWLYGIVLNVCRSALRSRRINYLSWEALAGGLHFDVLPFASVEPGPQEIAEANELIACVRAAVDGLSPKNRQATLLFYFEGCSMREIAAQLGISVVAVKGRLHKARLQLHDALQAAYLPAIDRTPAALSSPEKETEMIQVTITDIVQQEGGNHVIVLLDEIGKRILPIWIGPFEAESIALVLRQVQVPRPLTYQFMANILNATKLHLEKVCVSSLQNSTYYATATLNGGEEIYEVDARPSDAIALALHMNAPIYTAAAVMEQAGTPIPEQFKGKLAGKGLDAMLQPREERLATMRQQTEAASEKSKQESEAEREKLLAYLFSEERTA